MKQRVTDRFLFIHNLEERVAYTFSVRAQTIDYGPSVMGNVTTGPQSGSPGRPRDLELSKTMSSIKLSWTNSNSGRGPILGYYIESRRKGRYPIHLTKYSYGDGISFTLAEEEWQICEYPKKYFRTSVTNTVPNTRIICITVIQQKKFEINHLRLFDPIFLEDIVYNTCYFLQFSRRGQVENRS